jgi:hypothetical protein
MAYIGKTPVIGNFVKLDAISVVNGQAAYTMNNGGSAFTNYDNVNQFLVSLNGILQAPTDSFSVSGSTLTFASNLATGDVIDFVIVLGNTLDIGTPSDNTVSTAKLQDSSVSLAKLTATGTKDATTFLRGDNTFAEPTGGSHVLLSTTTVSSGVAQVDITSNIDSTYNNYLLSITNMHIASSSNFRMRFFTGTGGSQAVDSGSNYKYSGIGFRNDRTTELSTGGTNTFADIVLGQNIGSDNEDSLCANFYLCNPSNTTFNTLFKGDFAMIDGSDNIVHGINGLNYLSTTAVTGVRFFMEAGNIDSGIFKLYGIV